MPLIMIAGAPPFPKIAQSPRTFLLWFHRGIEPSIERGSAAWLAPLTGMRFIASLRPNGPLNPLLLLGLLACSASCSVPAAVARAGVARTASAQLWTGLDESAYPSLSAHLQQLPSNQSKLPVSHRWKLLCNGDANDPFGVLAAARSFCHCRGNQDKIDVFELLLHTPATQTDQNAPARCSCVSRYGSFEVACNGVASAVATPTVRAVNVCAVAGTNDETAVAGHDLATRLVPTTIGLLGYGVDERGRMVIVTVAAEASDVVVMGNMWACRACKWGHVFYAPRRLNVGVLSTPLVFLAPIVRHKPPRTALLPPYVTSETTVAQSNIATAVAEWVTNPTTATMTCASITDWSITATMSAASLFVSKPAFNDEIRGLGVPSGNTYLTFNSATAFNQDRTQCHIGYQTDSFLSRWVSKWTILCADGPSVTSISKCADMRHAQMPLDGQTGQIPGQYALSLANDDLVDKHKAQAKTRGEEDSRTQTWPSSDCDAFQRPRRVPKARPSSTQHPFPRTRALHTSERKCGVLFA
jgi:hypothetical protein